MITVSAGWLVNRARERGGGGGEEVKGGGTQPHVELVCHTSVELASLARSTIPQRRALPVCHFSLEPYLLPSTFDSE